jgi:hypothetical protein
MQQAGSNLFPTLQQDLQEEEQDKLLLAEAQAVIASIEAEQRAQLYTKSPQVEPSPHRSMHSTKDDLFAYLDEILAGHSINDIEDVMKTASNIPEDALPTKVISMRAKYVSQMAAHQQQYHQHSQPLPSMVCVT